MKTLKEIKEERIQNYLKRKNLLGLEKEHKLLMIIFGKTKEEKRIFAPIKLTPKERIIRDRERQKNQYKNINRKLGTYLRNRINMALKRNSKSEHLKDVLGCSIKFFKEYLQKQFKRGMSWDNWGKWHIDHIRPCVSFDLSRPEEQARCFHYTNLRPLWAIDNLKRPRKRGKRCY